MKTVRIGAGLGFYGDSWEPIAATIERGDVQYIASDHLAELTLAILQKDRAADPAAGFTRDLVPMMTALWPLAQPKGIKFILNAGGLNPAGARDALAAQFARKGWHAKIAVVTGDDVLGELPALGLAPSQSLVFANAYLGAAPVVEALAQGADIVLTGRVADAALFLAPLVYEFGWSLAPDTQPGWDKLAQGITVGHLLECSGQGSGGNFGGLDWADIPDLAHIGYPIAQVDADGGAIICKAPGTGGRISFDTVREQLLYEVHDPANYITPDVILDMSEIELDDLGGDQVRVRGARGKPRPAELKVIGGFADGWMGQASIGYSWPHAYRKAEQAAGIVTQLLKERGVPYDELRIEYQGYDSILGPLADPATRDALNEVYLRVAIRSADKRAADGLGRLLPPLALSGPPFVAGRFAPQPATQLLGTWSGLAPRALVEARVAVDVMEV